MSEKAKTVLILCMLCIIIAIVPLVFIQDSEFGGADGKAEEVIKEINPEYEAWTAPILEPPGGETESLLFSLQAAIGAGLIGYGFGVLRERSKQEREEDSKCC